MSLGKTEEGLKLSSPVKEARFYQFGPFLLDSQKRLLWLKGQLVELEPIPLKTLLVLVQAKGELVEKESLVNQVWEGDAITDNSLTRNIHVLRKTLALGFNGGECIRNIPKRGYCFLPPVIEHSERPRAYIDETTPKLNGDSAGTTSHTKIGKQQLLLSFRLSSRRRKIMAALILATCILVVFYLFFRLRSQQPDVSGEWTGLLTVPAAQARLAVHISQNDGQLQATIDSPDQGIFGVPVTNISGSDNELRFGITYRSVSFRGALSKDGTRIQGILFQQGTELPLPLTRQTDSNAQNSAGTNKWVGVWTGLLDSPGSKYHVVLHLKPHPQEGSTTIDSPDQGIFNIPVSSISHSGNDLKFAIAAWDLRFSGAFQDHGSALRGTVIQFGRAGDVVLTRQQSRLAGNDVVAAITRRKYLGTWVGVVNDAQGPLRFVLHMFQEGNELKASADSPDQGIFGVPATIISQSEAELKIAVPAWAATFTGQLDAKTGGIRGAFTQEGKDKPVLMTKQSGFDGTPPRR